MKFKIWHEKGIEEFEANDLYVKEGVIVATEESKTVAAISVQNVYCVTREED